MVNSIQSVVGNVAITNIVWSYAMSRSYTYKIILRGNEEVERQLTSTSGHPIEIHVILRGVPTEVCPGDSLSVTFVDIATSMKVESRHFREGHLPELCCTCDSYLVMQALATRANYLYPNESNNGPMQRYMSITPQTWKTAEN